MAWAGGDRHGFGGNEVGSLQPNTVCFARVQMHRRRHGGKPQVPQQLPFTVGVKRNG